jgi:hypothetical protein
MDWTTGAPASASAQQRGGYATPASPAPHTPHPDYVLVPRSVLERLLTHGHAGYQRFPTRHLKQIIQTLQHLLAS